MSLENALENLILENKSLRNTLKYKKYKAEIYSRIENNEEVIAQIVEEMNRSAPSGSQPPTDEEDRVEEVEQSQDVVTLKKPKKQKKSTHVAEPKKPGRPKKLKLDEK